MLTVTDTREKCHPLVKVAGIASRGELSGEGKAIYSCYMSVCHDVTR